MQKQYWRTVSKVLESMRQHVENEMQIIKDIFLYNACE